MNWRMTMFPRWLVGLVSSMQALVQVAIRVCPASLLGVCLCLAGDVARAADAKLPFSAPVKDLSSSGVTGQPAVQSPALREQPDRPQPTLPGGKLPQYQLDHQHRAIPTADELQNPRLRLILALPAEPVLIEAVITIDGRPFQMAREQRVRQILDQVGRALPPVNPQTGESRNDTALDVAPYTLATTLPERIHRYIEATGEVPTADEVRWLLTNWVDGPTLLMLNDNFQRFRANQRPVFEVLDRNRDATVAADELLRAVESFQECDLNRNQIVEYTELAKVADDPRSKKSTPASPGQLLFQMPDVNSAAATYLRLASHYQVAGDAATAIVPLLDKNADGHFDSDELAALHTAEPALRFAISFDSANPADSRIELSGASPALTEAVASGSVEASAIVLPLGGTLVAFSAVQAGASDQVSVGAVNDGYPLLPVLDPNEDGRFTIRELRGLVERLQQVDRNQDGRLTGDEAQAIIRICFGLGPHVHRELAELRRVKPEAYVTAVVGPEWFRRMDRNRDNDLTRGEFPGTDEQFAQLDTDNDELVSAEEAVRFDKKSGNSTKIINEPEPLIPPPSSNESN